MTSLWNLDRSRGPAAAIVAGETLPEAFANMAALRGDAAFLCTKRLGLWVRTSWREAAAAVSELAAGMSALGIRSGDVVCIVSRTRAECVVADLAVLSLGAVSAAIVPSLTKDIATLCRDIGAALVIVDDADQLAALCGNGWSDDVPVVVMDDGLGYAADARHVSSWRALREKGRGLADTGEARPSIAVAADAIAILSFTAGTTAAPVAVRHSHRAVLGQCRELNAIVPHLAADSRLSFLPWARVNERLWAMYLPMLAGMTITFCEGRDTVAENLREVAPSIVSATPRQLEGLRAEVLSTLTEAGALPRAAFAWALRCGDEVAHRVVARESVGTFLRAKTVLGRVLVLDNVRRSMGLGRCRHLIVADATLPRAVAAWYLAMGIPVVQTWGITQALGVSTVGVLPDLEPGHAGRPLLSHRVHADAQSGELQVRLIDRGREATDFAWRSGDLGRIDAGGPVRIDGRIDEQWHSSSGDPVASSAFRSALRESRYVEDVLVFGANRPFAAALILPAREATEQHAHRAGIPFSNFADLCRRPEVRALLQSDIDRANAALPDSHQVRRFELIDDDLGPGDEEMTPSLLLRRWAVEARRSRHIDSLYS